MKTRRSRYYGYRFPPEIISHAFWLYHRFCLSFRDVEDLLAERCILVTYETIRRWCQKFGPDYARKLQRLQGRLGDTWHLDELFLKSTASCNTSGGLSIRTATCPWRIPKIGSLFLEFDSSVTEM
jgi:transposase-like protein